ncbi:MAG: hypothetical protein LBN40_05880 [Oscillospiraceae bacterium]|jgi:hypothetical protein|nr:hypothetical protein [Oscillospiraceae bacterium]
MSEPIKREVAAVKKGIGVSEILLIAILIAAGAVLKAFSNTIFSFTPLKPNMVIAMYTLAILLIRPKFLEAAAIGLIAGIVCNFLPGATPYANIASELLGGIACFLIIIPLAKQTAARISTVKVAVTAFLTTLISGWSFFAMLYVLLLTGMEVKVMMLGVFAGVIFGTAAVNAVIVSLLYPALYAVRNRRESK